MIFFLTAERVSANKEQHRQDKRKRRRMRNKDKENRRRLE